jgi:hypothetical protein
MVQEILTEYELIVDSSEQPRERQGDYKEQKNYYSGKKKSHTFKNKITVLPDGQDIVDIIAGEPGPTSDINLFRSGRNGFNRNQKFKGNKSYQGEESINTPTKKAEKRRIKYFSKREK